MGGGESSQVRLPSPEKRQAIRLWFKRESLKTVSVRRMTWQWSLLLMASWTGSLNVAVAKEGGPLDAMASLLAVVPKEAPKVPEVRNLPESLIFHGDLFGDNRHLALVAKDGETIAAEFDKLEWREIARWPVAPAWVVEGESREDKGYFHINPPACPFILKDLDGDRIPEVLIAFDDDSYKLSYRIVKKRSDASGLELLTLSSTGEPSYREGYLITYESTGRKAWGGGERYFRWTKGLPVFAAERFSDCWNPDRELTFYTRVLPDKSEETFCVRFDDGWQVRRCGSREEPRNEKPFVDVRFIARTPGAEWPEEAEEAFLFQKLTGLNWKSQVPRAGEVAQDQLGKEFSKFKTEIHGEPEAVRIFDAMPTPAP